MDNLYSESMIDNNDVFMKEFKIFKQIKEFKELISNINANKISVIDIQSLNETNLDSKQVFLNVLVVLFRLYAMKAQMLNSSI